jgi:UDP-N-acetylmuramyl pentapeptide synthase
LAKGLEYLEQHLVPLPEPYPGCILFFTVAAEGKAASVFHVRATTLEAAWREGATRVRQWAWARKRDEVDLRIDWAQDITPLKADSPPSECSLWSQPAIASLALADASLDRAQPLHRLLPAQAVGPASKPLLAMEPREADPGEPPFAGPCLLLHLRGVYISGAEPAVAVPRNGSPEDRLWTQLVPVHAALEQLLALQREDGSWPGTEDICDHLGLTYALLQAQRHAGSAALARGIALALGHFERQLPGLPQGGLPQGGLPQDGLPQECLPRAMALLVLARHLRNTFVFSPGADGQARAATAALLDQLAEALLTTAAIPPGPAQSAVLPPALDWAELALHAYVNSRPRTADSPALRAARSALSDTATLPAAFIHAALPQLQQAAGPAAPDQAAPGPGARWVGIALAESLQFDAGLEPQPADILGQWRTLLLRQLQSVAMRCVWPEQALHLPHAQRRHAAFADASHRQVLHSPQDIARLLVSSLAGLELLDAVTQALRPPPEPQGPQEERQHREALAAGTPPGHGRVATSNGPAPAHALQRQPPPEERAAPPDPYPPLSWSGSELAQFMKGRWQDLPAPQMRTPCTGLDASRQHHLPGAAALVRRAGMASGIPGAALQSLRASALISSNPQGLLRHGLPVLHVPDLEQGLLGLAGAARQRIKAPVVAVTGCVGKTSTLGMLRQCLQDGGDARSDALLAQDTALQMINWSEAAPCALVELPLHRLRADIPLIDPDILVITNLSTSDIPRIREATAPGTPPAPHSEAFKELMEAVQCLRRGSTLVAEHEIGINPHLIEKAEQSGVKIITFGPHSQARVREMAFHNGNLELAIGDRRLGISLQSDGHHMAMNAQAALATLHVLGHAPGPLHASLAHWLPPTGAGQPQLLPSGICLLDHSLSNHLLSMKAAFVQLQCHAPHASRRLVVLAGIRADPGQVDISQLALEPLVRAAQARRVLLYGDALQALAAALGDLLHVNWYDDLNQLICSLLRTAHKGDTVLLAGRATTNLALAADAIRDSVGSHTPTALPPIDCSHFDIHQKQMNLHS